ncbi:vitamin K epoxide reductase family protein [Sinomicrobium oceani]|uniref:vitamin K epoxide reductase family protein n=1 Tax=Sinomicrobium oceani TaxID=1150368 RepID=UPI00227C7F38|nr:vitamin K epoxide reductase family protein [Sinomicrobium oceani]
MDNYIKNKKWVKETSEYSNTKAALENLFILQEEQISVNEIEKDPKYPRVESVVNFLNRSGIENLVVKLNENELKKVPFPCLAQIVETDNKNPKNGQARFVVLNSFDNDGCNYLDPKIGWVQKEAGTFLNISTGVFVLVSKSEDGVGNKANNLADGSSPDTNIFPVWLVVTIFFILAIGYALGGKADLLGKLAFLLNLGGIALSLLLIQEQYSLNNNTASKLCGILSLKGKSSDSCSEVINSKASKVFGIKFSDIGFLFFGFIVMIMLLNTTSFSGTEASLSLTRLLITAAIPFTIFSVFYQGIIIKKWCAFCIWVQMIIWANFILFFVFNFKGYELGFLTNGYSITIIFAALLILIIWRLTGKNYSLNNSLSETEKKLFVYENDTVVFNGLLKDEKSVPFSTNEYDIILGNQDSKNTLLIYTNPLCPSCRIVHQYIDEILKREQQYFRIVIRFLVAEIAENDFSKSPKNPATALAIAALQIYRCERSSEDKIEFLRVMRDIYSVENINGISVGKWIFGRVGTINNKEYIEKALRNHKNVATEAGIENTPTVYINGIYYKYGILYLKNILNNVYLLKEEVAG